MLLQSASFLKPHFWQHQSADPVPHFAQSHVFVHQVSIHAKLPGDVFAAMIKVQTFPIVNELKCGRFVAGCVAAWPKITLAITLQQAIINITASNHSIATKNTKLTKRANGSLSSLCPSCPWWFHISNSKMSPKKP